MKGADNLQRQTTEEIEIQNMSQLATVKPSLTAVFTTHTGGLAQLSHLEKLHRENIVELNDSSD